MRTLLLGKNSDVYENRQYLLSRIDVNEGKKEGQMEDRGKIGEWIYNGLSDHILHSVGGVIGENVQRCLVFHTHVHELSIFEQRNPNLSHVETYKQNSLHFSMKHLCSLDHSGDWNGPETGSPRAGNEEFR
ncbi:hypothetical protein TNCV_2550361 [Trichonephila clavipes]|nr:hypothetical protein TNCV_2550361 [Trichonephila clavipes]